MVTKLIISECIIAEIEFKIANINIKPCVKHCVLDNYIHCICEELQGKRNRTLLEQIGPRVRLRKLLYRGISGPR